MTAPTQSAGSRIRVALIIDRLFFPSGGTEGQLLRLAENLDRRRFEPTVFCLESTNYVEFEYDRVPVCALDLRLSPHPLVLRRIWDFARLLRAGEFDVVQTYFRDANIVGILAAMLAGVDVIVSARRGIPIWSNRADFLLLQLLNRRVDRFVANSRATSEHYTRIENIDPQRMEVIYNGLDPKRFRRPPLPRQLALRAELGIGPEQTVVGTVANLRLEKGLTDFIEAGARVRSSHPEACFVIVGGGPEEESLRAKARDLGVEDGVLFLGKRPDIPELLGIFDVGVLASHFESFSNSILEYLAAGLPVVATDVGGAREAVRDGVDGFLVPPGDPASMAEKIRFLLERPAGARSWRADPEIRGRFHTRSMTKAYEDLYTGLVEAARGA